MAETHTGAELFVDALERYGVTHLFGNPGTTELPVMDALSRSDIEYVLGLQEDVAVGAAAGYAQARRYHSHHDPSVTPLGVVNLHVTPGLAHGVGNLYGAKMTGAPLLVTAGNHELDFRHEEPILSGDLVGMVEQFCKYATEVTSVEALPMVLRRAVRTALTPPTGPVFLALPVDVMLAETDTDPEPLGPIPDAGEGDPVQVARAADYLVEADEPVLVLGDQVARAGPDAIDAAVRLAEATGARVHAEILGSEVNFPTDHDQWISFIGVSEGIASMLMNADTLAFVGVSTNTTLLRHESPLVPRESTTVQISPDPWEVGKNVPADAAVVGDPGRVMDALAEQVEARVGNEERERRLDSVRGVKESLADTMRRMGEDDKPDGETRASKAQLVDAMAEAAPEALIVDEGVTSKFALQTRFPLSPEGFIANKGGGLGYGLPAAVGVALAERETETPRSVLGFVGDGSYLYYPNAMYTAARHDLDLTVVVSDNRNYRILKHNTVEMLGGEEADYEFVGMDFEPAVDIPKNAESHGARGRLVETPGGIAPALEEALSTPGPDVLDVLVHD
jgi:benzoylformate decarboxylase